MTRRILFVDDEALILGGLQRMLRGMRAEWEMVFAESGAKALELMEQAPFDVVVSDMRMPGMNGASLLAEVMKRSPKTIRLILSGHADQELILKCIGSTHQYLSKPCEPDTLKAAISRAFELETSLQNPKLKELITRMDRLPSIPALYGRIVDKLRNPDVGLDEVGELIAQDPGMTAKILKLVNSSFFGLRRQISSCTEAVTYIGIDTIKSLVLSIDAFSQFDQVKCKQFSIECLWAHSQETATLAREIARMEDADRKVADECYVAGLLHDIGKLILAANFPEQYELVLQERGLHDLGIADAEEQFFCANHAIVGGYLLGLWGLPVPVVEAITFHHYPARGPHKGFGPLTAVYAANRLLGASSQLEDDNSQASHDQHYLEGLGLTDRFQAWKAALLPEKENLNHAISL